jgi:hypothetical protein
MTLAVRNDGSGKAAGKFSPVGLVPQEVGVHDARSPGVGEKFVPIADQGPGGDGKFDADPAGAGIGEVHHFPFAHGQFSVTTPMKASSQSMKSRSMGSLTIPPSCFKITSGRPTQNSNPSRRMVSMRMAS